MNIISYIKNKLTGIKLAVLEDGTAKIDSVNGFKIAESGGEEGAKIVEMYTDFYQEDTSVIEEILKYKKEGYTILTKSTYLNYSPSLVSINYSEDDNLLSFTYGNIEKFYVQEYKKQDDVWLWVGEYGYKYSISPIE